MSKLTLQLSVPARGVLCVLGLLLVGGCGTKMDTAPRTGFLSDYSRLRTVDDSTLRYIAPGRLGQYRTFVIDPVTIYLHGDSEGHEIPPNIRQELALYMRGTMVDALAGPYDITPYPGPGVARLRIAITDIKSSTQALTAMPQMRMIGGAGLGGVAIEAELLDSQSGEQIAALVETRLASRLALTGGWSEWGDCKAVMDDWAKRFRKRMDEMHGR